MPNRLVHEKSPYLMQHAHNPVDWYPWGPEAFTKAQQEDKPVFLSIGYSTCHWCHVMETDSFMDLQVAEMMNQVFVCIKVDREERPDIDAVYIAVCQLMTGSAGWPLTIILTPNQKPFFAATFIPKNTTYGRMGMLELIPRIQQVWIERRAEVESAAETIKRSLQEASKDIPHMELGPDIFHQAFQNLQSQYDVTFGGFGQAPKFPTPHHYSFLMRYWQRTQNESALQMVIDSMQKIRRGGIYDHLGSGFHRYSTDAQWLVPHFEKMLYDQALMILVFSEAYQISQNQDFAATAQDIIEYVQRELTHPEGAFFSAEDADSEGQEGKFYLWTSDEIQKILGPEAEDFGELFHIHSDGNFVDQATHLKTGENILHLRKEPRDFAYEKGLDWPTFSKKMVAFKEKLFQHREKRVRPFKDDKILTDWNGLMIAALAKAARVYQNKRYLDLALKAEEFILTTLRDDQGNLLHRYRDGQAAIPGLLDDYAFMIWGLIELYQSTFRVAHLQHAISLSHKMVEQFWDDERGGFYSWSSSGETLLVRQKESYDGAIPSGNSVAMLNFIRLARLTGQQEWEIRAHRIAQAFANHIEKVPAAHTMMLCAMDFAMYAGHEVILVGSAEDEQIHEMIRAIGMEFFPNLVVLLKSEDAAASQLEELAPFLKKYPLMQNRATAYVCQNYRCDLPVHKVADMLKLLHH